MVLSSKKVVISSDGLDWTQNLLQSHHQTLDHQFPKQQPLIRRQQQNQSEPLKCPRCDSSNTKFCYYNNYNKSQPRHFCKSCKRHWTKGGTLRNVPVGGGRKNKSHKSSKTTTISTAVTTAAAATTSTNHNVNIINRVNSHPPLPIGGQKNFSEILYRASLISPASASASSSSALQQNSISNNSYGVLFGSNLSLPQTHDQGLNFPYPNPFQSSNFCEYTGEPLEDSTITTTSSTVTLPWQAPNTNFWNWDDIDNLVSTTDLNIPWNDGPEIKP